MKTILEVIIKTRTGIETPFEIVVATDIDLGVIGIGKEQIEMMLQQAIDQAVYRLIIRGALHQ
jgi:hypothetical protein